MQLFQSLNELIFPTRCIACGALGLSLCTNCRREWNPHIYVSRIGRDAETELTVISSVTYSSVAQKIILGAKESHIKECDRLVSEAVTHALQKFLATTSIDFLIPIPSRRSAARLRGRQFIAEIAAAGSKTFDIPIAHPLTHSRPVRDQSGLHLEERWNNLEGAFVVKGEQVLPGGVLLIDDLVTTGATLCEAARALRYAGIKVIGAVTAALAQPLR